MSVRVWAQCFAVCFLTVCTRVHGVGDDAAKMCKSQQDAIQSKLTAEGVRATFVSEFIFTNESKPQLLLTWAGNHTVIVVVTETQPAGRSDVYRSTNDGRSFAKITNLVALASGGVGDGTLRVMPANGLQHNPAAPNWVYLICYDLASPGSSSLLYLTRDGGATWQNARLSFLAQSPIQFHPTNPSLLLAQAPGGQLHLSSDSGLAWRQLRDHVYKASWGTGGGADSDAIYAACDHAAAADYSSLLRNSQAGAGRQRAAERQLFKSTDSGASWHLLADNIYSYKNLENFLFVSRADSDSTDSRHLAVSTDFGASFNRTQLPSATSDRFFVILDVSDGLAFVHMAAGNYQGFGTLFTSNSAGCLFSKSLERHLYPPLGSGSDFYKVESMRGTYLTTVLHPDNSMHSVVTHNRGAVWRPLRRPDGGVCKEDATGNGKLCSLQVASSYSLMRGVLADPPMSAASASGLVVVHGNTATSLQTNDTEVYISSDGGHAWSKALTGPHRVQIGNNGNYLVAVPMGGQSPQVVKFSTDAGRCWHSHRFTSENYTFTGLLTEPGNRELTVAIWGYVGASRHWRVFVIDLAQLLNRTCTDADYEPWVVNGAISGGGETVSACLLGAKETIQRLRPDSMCTSNRTYQPAKDLQPCQCTMEDFECEYGYTRPVNSLNCSPDPGVATPEICDADTVSKIVTDGYRKLPGNRCEGGFQPNKTRQVVLRNGPCPLAQEDPRVRDGRLLIQHLEEQKLLAKSRQSSRTIGLIVPMCITVGILLAIVLSLVVLARLRERRRRRLAFHYSVVSSTGRRSDLAGGGAEPDLEYQPADGILNNGGPKPRAYSATATAAAPASSSKRRSDDKHSLLAASAAADEEDDDAPIF